MALINRRFFFDLDYLLLASALGLALLGIVGIHSATADLGTGHVNSQLIRILLGLIVCLVLTSIDYHRLIDYAFLLYGGAIALLLATLVFGTEIKGSTSWIVFMGMRFQPSEAAKLVVIIVLARYIGSLQHNYLEWKQIATLGGICLLPVVLVILQGDMGTTLMYFPIVAGMLIVGGLKFRVLVIILLVAALLTPVMWFLLQDHQKERILVTLNPDLDPHGVGYQTRQSKIAIGSGGFLGKGLGQGLQSRLGFVPEIRTDFIFALLAEETGLLGAGLILLLFLLLLFRIVAVGEIARDRPGLLLITGVACLVFAHVATNIGMTLGLAPVIGVPLPFVSYGGSSILTMFAALGIVMNVHRQRFIYRPGREGLLRREELGFKSPRMEKFRS